MPWLLLILPFLVVLKWLSRHSGDHDPCRPDRRGWDRHHHRTHHHDHHPHGWRCCEDDEDCCHDHDEDEPHHCHHGDGAHCHHGESAHCHHGDGPHCHHDHDPHEHDPHEHDGDHDHDGHHHGVGHDSHGHCHHHDPESHEAPDSGDAPANPWTTPAESAQPTGHVPPTHAQSSEEVGAEEAATFYPDPTTDDGYPDGEPAPEEPTLTEQHAGSLPDETSEQFRTSLPDDRVVGPDSATEAEMSGWLGEVGEVLADEDLDGPNHPSETSSEDEELASPGSWNEQNTDQNG